jgi:predicted NBD/HSP70 family sugar kinase
MNRIPAIELEAKHVAEAAIQGDRLAIQVFTEAMGYLGRAIAGLLNIFNPQAIILGGGVSLNGSIFWDTLKPLSRRMFLTTDPPNTTSCLQPMKVSPPCTGHWPWFCRKFSV